MASALRVRLGAIRATLLAKQGTDLHEPMSMAQANALLDMLVATPPLSSQDEAPQQKKKATRITNNKHTLFATEKLVSSNFGETRNDSPIYRGLGASVFFSAASLGGLDSSRRG